MPALHGERPSDDEWKETEEVNLIRNVIERELTNGIRVRVRRDGLFVFDFSTIPEADETEIPHYDRVPGPIPREVTEAKNLADRKTDFRTKVINVHQACLSTAHTVVHKRGSPLTKIVTRETLLHPEHFHDDGGKAFRLGNDPFQRYLTIQTTLDPFFRNAHPEVRSRPVLEMDTIDYSLDLLDRILTHDFTDLALIVKILFHAGTHFSHSHFAECLIMSWAVSERCLDGLWGKYLSEKRETENKEVRVTADRLKKLKGRDFSASVISEILELNGCIDTSLYEKLETSRRARNKAVHELNAVDDRSASQAFLTAIEMLAVVTGIKLHICLSRSISGMVPC